MLDLKLWQARKLTSLLCIVGEFCHFVNKCPFEKDELPLKMICQQMSRCKLTKSKIALTLQVCYILLNIMNRINKHKKRDYIYSFKVRHLEYVINYSFQRNSRNFCNLHRKPIEILQIEETCHRPLCKWQRKSTNSVRAKERYGKWFFLSLSTRTALASALARDSLTRNAFSLSPELTGFKGFSLACLLYL